MESAGGGRRPMLSRPRRLAHNGEVQDKSACDAAAHTRRSGASMPKVTAMSQEMLQSVATLLGRHAGAQRRLRASSTHSASPHPGTTEAHVAQLDDLFADVVSSLRDSSPDLRKHFDVAASSIARVVDDIARNDPQASVDALGIASALLSFRHSGSTGTTVENSSDGSEARSKGSLGSGAAVGKRTASETAHARAPSTLAAPPALLRTQSVPLPAPHAVAQRPAAPAGGNVARKKRYRKPVPSTHCHICCRPSRSVPVVVCANIFEGTCRKSICSLCISEHKLGEWDKVTVADSGWVCCHCVDGCSNVARAQCFVYSRTNLKRKLAGASKKRQRPATVSEPAVEARAATAIRAGNAMQAWIERDAAGATAAAPENG